MRLWFVGLKSFMVLYGWVEADMTLQGVPPSRREPGRERDDMKATFRIERPSAQ